MEVKYAKDFLGNNVKAGDTVVVSLASAYNHTPRLEKVEVLKVTEGVYSWIHYKKRGYRKTKKMSTNCVKVK